MFPRRATAAQSTKEVIEDMDLDICVSAMSINFADMFVGTILSDKYHRVAERR